MEEGVVVDLRLGVLGSLTPQVEAEVTTQSLVLSLCVLSGFLQRSP